jgi:oligopeptide/dipeptide ABC transporter ATP-binding protein
VSGLNPVLPIGRPVSETLRTHLGLSKHEARRAAVEALRTQGLVNPERVADSYPFQLSGGMCQRVMIAIATALEPDVIIADEPTSSLDVTVQAALLAELRDLQRRKGTSLLLITHDLGVIAGATDDVAIMYAGRIVERGQTTTIFPRARHPYTAALMSARPRIDDPGRRLQTISGVPADLSRLSDTCAFLARCTKAINDCRSAPWPPLRNTAPEHAVACFNPMHESAL